MLGLGFVHAPVTTLGPGRRVGLWFRGCTIHCPSCISKELWAFSEAEDLVPVVEVAQHLRRLAEQHGCDGVTISGGEPFDQPQGLHSLLQLLHKVGLCDILVYSGYSLPVLLRNYAWIPDLLTCIVDGAFMQANPTLLTWKGSDNQEMHLFTTKHIARYEKWRISSTAAVQLVRSGETTRLIGIPRQGDAFKERQKHGENKEM